MCNVTCGIPQGSLLGQLLFLIDVNDMQIGIESDCKVLLYADDTAILFSDKNTRIISQKLSGMLKSCHEWLVDNKLSLHLGKTEIIIFGPKRRLQIFSLEDFKISCNGINIEAKNSVKYLGIMFDQFLSGDLIVSSIIKKVNQRLTFLYRNKNCLSLCSTLIQCHFDYACACWYEGLTNNMNDKLQIAQNKIVRFILNLHHRKSVTYIEFEKLGFLNICNRVKQLRLYHVYNIFNNKSPEYMHTNFKINISLYGTRSINSNLCIPPIKGGESTTFFYSGIKDWNSLPDQIKSCNNKNSVNFFY